MLNYCKEIVEFFELGKFQAVDSLPSGYANKNYRLQTSSGKYLLRDCLQQTSELLQYEIELMALLQSYKFPAAYPTAGKNKNFVLIIGSHNFMIYDFLDGIEPVINQQTCSEMGKAIGLLSTVGPYQQFEYRKNTLDMDHIVDLINHFPKAKNSIPDVFNFIESYADKFIQLSRKNLPKGIIHGDAFANNTIFNQQNELLGIIDFEEACVDFLMLDVGMTINGFCFINNSLDQNLLAEFVNNYQTLRPLKEEEAYLLLDFIQFAAYSMMCWHMRFNLVDIQYPKQESRVRELMVRIQNLEGTREELNNLSKDIEQ